LFHKLIFLLNAQNNHKERDGFSPDQNNCKKLVYPFLLQPRPSVASFIPSSTPIFIVAKLSSSWKFHSKLSWVSFIITVPVDPSWPDLTWPDRKSIKTAFYSKSCFAKLVAQSKWKTTSIFFWMEDDLNCLSNGRRPHFSSHGRWPQLFSNGRHLNFSNGRHLNFSNGRRLKFLKWKTTSIFQMEDNLIFLQMGGDLNLLLQSS
jgi:hypothetical protein